MSKETLEWRDQRANLIAMARKVLDDGEELAKKEGRKGLLPSEENKYDEIMADVETLKDKIDKHEKLEKAEKTIEEPQEPETMVSVTDTGKPLTILDTPEYRAAYTGWIHSGNKGLSPDQQGVLDKGYKAAMQADIDVSGGYLVVPTQMATTFIQALDDVVHIRQYATKETVTKAASLGLVSLDSDPDDGEWTAELDTGGETGIGLGGRELTPHPLAKRALISNKLLRIADRDPEALLISRLVYKYSVTHEKGFLTGTGSNQPLGIMTASDDGIPTSRDVVSGTTTAITADGIKDVKYSLKSQYWPNAKWMFHRDAVKQIAKLKDSNGQYIWSGSVREGDPDMLEGSPMLVSEYMPNTFTTGQYVGFYGDISYYMIADALDMQIQRLVELYSKTYQTGFHARAESDGMPTLAEAFSRCKLA